MRHASFLPREYMPVWWNWQTPGTQNPVSARTCGFDPRHRHHVGANCAHGVFGVSLRTGAENFVPLRCSSFQNRTRCTGLRFCFFGEAGVFTKRMAAFLFGFRRTNVLLHPKGNLTCSGEVNSPCAKVLPLAKRLIRATPRGVGANCAHGVSGVSLRTGAENFVPLRCSSFQNRTRCAGLRFCFLISKNPL